MQLSDQFHLPGPPVLEPQSQWDSHARSTPNTDTHTGAGTSTDTPAGGPTLTLTEIPGYVGPNGGKVYRASDGAMVVLDARGFAVPVQLASAPPAAHGGGHTSGGHTSGGHTSGGHVSGGHASGGHASGMGQGMMRGPPGQVRLANRRDSSIAGAFLQAWSCVCKLSLFASVLRLFASIVRHTKRCVVCPSGLHASVGCFLQALSAFASFLRCTQSVSCCAHLACIMRSECCPCLLAFCVTQSVPCYAHLEPERFSVRQLTIPENALHTSYVVVT